MAIANATPAQREELKRQLTIVSKDVYALITQPLGMAGRGPEIDAKFTALSAAIAAVTAA